jgi:hypothetical protein
MSSPDLKPDLKPDSPADEAAASRRDFVARMAVGGLALAATACAGHAAASAPTPATTAAVPPTGQAHPGRNAPPIPIPPAKNDGPWDFGWLDRLPAAKYKMVFDIGTYADGGGLYYAKNYLNGMRDGWGIESPDVIAVLGISGDAFPIVFNDTVWTKYKLGESSKTTDPRTNVPAVRNIWWEPRPNERMAEFGVDVLQRRGAQFIFCNNVFRGVIRRFMAETQRSYADIRGELAANFLPGVIVVPAMVAAMGMAQARGCAYVYAGA